MCKLSVVEFTKFEQIMIVKFYNFFTCKSEVVKQKVLICDGVTHGFYIVCVSHCNGEYFFKMSFLKCVT